MENKRKPVTLNVKIEPEALKRVVEEGRLMEFVNAFSMLAAEHIEAQVVEQITKAAVGLHDVSKGINFGLNFDIDDPYRTGPIPPPRPRGTLDEVIGIAVARGLRREGIGLNK